MSTPINPTEKQNFLNLVAVAPLPGGPSEVERLQIILVNYEDINTAIQRQQELFASNNSYLTQAMDCFNDNQLQAVGIWNNKQQASPPLTNPVLIVNSRFDTVDLTTTSPAIYVGLTLMGDTYIGRLNLSLGVILNELYIGPGCTIDVYAGAAYVSSPPVFSKTNTIWMPNIKNMPATLNAATYQSQIGNIILEPGSYYGGVQNNDPNLPCAQNVIGVTVTEQTKSAFLVSWTPPTLNSPLVSPANNYLFLKVFFKLHESSPWIMATELDGDWIGDMGFIFRHLEVDTFYDIRIQTQCQNGGIANVDITVQTVCCGAGSRVPLWMVCPVVCYIKDSPDTSLMQTLCNGVQIQKEYPSGPTLTIPYLADPLKAQLQPNLVVDNNNYQFFPFDVGTGTFDASTTSLVQFIEPNVITINVNLPMP